MTGLQFNKLTAIVSGHTMLDCVLGCVIAILIHNIMIVYFE